MVDISKLSPGDKFIDDDGVEHTVTRNEVLPDGTRIIAYDEVSDGSAITFTINADSDPV